MSPRPTDKRPVHAARGMIVTNHPLASAAGAEMLAGGGNAVDAAVAALFALSVVEPMMVGVFGAGHAHLFLAGGRHTVLDGYTAAPAAARPDMFRPVSDAWPDYMEAAGRENSVGLRSVGVPGNLAAWCEMLARFGTLELPAVMAPAIRHAEGGFRVTGYLAECVAESAADLARFPDSARVYLPGGAPLRRGERLVQPDYAATLRTIAAEGPDALYGGALGRRVAEHMVRAGGLVTLDDLVAYRTVEREPVRGTYRGFEVAGCPPPTGGGIHLIQMLNILEGYDIGARGFASADTLHLLAEVLKIAFADRAAATADPAFVKVPVEKLLSKEYAAQRRSRIDLAHAQSWSAEVAPGEGAHTTHLTIADGMGN
ncbi:MAG TPA: gamma-glutamyltransferase, partial [Methylomirabilota bacterium]|nr:gamma-glutamyltransferase [Methylomirabilota bacterium]